MPYKNWTTVVIKKELYEKLKNYIDRVNSELGFRRYKSIAQAVEEAIIVYYFSKKKKQS